MSRYIYNILFDTPEIQSEVIYKPQIFLSPNIIFGEKNLGYKAANTGM